MQNLTSIIIPSKSVLIIIQNHCTDLFKTLKTNFKKILRGNDRVFLNLLVALSKKRTLIYNIFNIRNQHNKQIYNIYKHLEKTVKV